MAAARALLARTRSCVVLTGAGMSAESGVPTFRDAQSGLWAKYDPMQLASPEGFRANPALVWHWYASRREGVARASPNAGHVALVRCESRFETLSIVTQNVDGLHARAGSANVLELHGNIQRTRCFDGCGLRIDDPAQVPAGAPPVCPSCGAWLRPDVVWFGESLDPRVLDEAEARARSCDAMLVVGTAGVVYPAAGLPTLAKRHGAAVIVVNPNPSELDEVADLLVRASAARALPEVLPGPVT